MSVTRLKFGTREANECRASCLLAPQAPSFTLRVTPDQNLSLSDLAGRPVVITFYPVDWSPVCGDQTALYNEVLPEFHEHDAELLGISVDGARVSRGLRQGSAIALSLALVRSNLVARIRTAPLNANPIQPEARMRPDREIERDVKKELE
jgi:hypothetical protein